MKQETERNVLDELRAIDDIDCELEDKWKLYEKLGLGWLGDKKMSVDDLNVNKNVLDDGYVNPPIILYMFMWLLIIHLMPPSKILSNLMK